MIISEHSVQIEGHMLHRTIFDPSEGEPSSVCLFSHGQGDFSKRYQDVLHPFTERGIRCISMDLLGHGLSPGTRGHCGGKDLIDKIIESNLLLAGNLPYGIAGHSMGGLLTLRHLVLALEGRFPLPRFCWVNSPLLEPAHGKADWFVKLARYLAKRAPKATIKTGATPELCQTLEAGVLRNSRQAAVKKELGHQKVSLAWGIDLIDIAKLVQERLPKFKSPIPFLFTQGDTDYICPHQHAENFLQQLKLPNVTYQLFENMRHETFAEPNNEDLFRAVSHWLEGCDIALKMSKL